MGKKRKEFRFIELISKLIEKTLNKKVYFDYASRVIILSICLVIFILISYSCLNRAIKIDDAKIINYQENGSSDYKVYLKENEFYEEKFLGKDMMYVANIIKSIDVDFNYNFTTSEKVNTDLNYDVVGKLIIMDMNGQSTIFEKNYTLVKNTPVKADKNGNISLAKNLSIDYGYYNQLANNFKNTYGIESQSNLIVTLRLHKNVSDSEGKLELPESSEMNIKIPLTEKAIQIKIDDSTINNASSIIRESKASIGNVVFIIIGLVSFILLVSFLLELLELLVALFPKQSEYDKAVRKILKEYDRFIVETSTFIDFSDKNVVKLERFEELLDARDNLKLPIMYHNVIDHHKCNFYIKQNKSIYLYVMKSTNYGKKSK